jgi:hypothetical protein
VLFAEHGSNSKAFDVQLIALVSIMVVLWSRGRRSQKSMTSSNNSKHCCFFTVLVAIDATPLHDDTCFLRLSIISHNSFFSRRQLCISVTRFSVYKPSSVFVVSSTCAFLGKVIRLYLLSTEVSGSR